MQTNIVITLVLAVFASSGFWSFAIHILDNKRKKCTVENEALLALLHDRLYQLARQYIYKEEITLEELQNLKHIYCAYNALGGNGTGKKLYEKCLDLPLKKLEYYSKQ